MSMLLFVRQRLFDIVTLYHSREISCSHKRLGYKRFLCVALLSPSLWLFPLVGCNTADQVHHGTISNVVPSHTFTVTGPPSLTIHSDSGSIRLHAGKNNAVVITATQHVTRINEWSIQTTQPVPNADDMLVNYDQQGNVIRVEALNISNAALRAVSVDFDVTMPVDGNVQIHTGFGSIEADGIHGKTALESQNGNITVHNIDGAITMNSSNGSVRAYNIQGALSLTLKNGAIELQNAALTGSSQVTSEHGTISFNGSLNPHGSYLFRTEMGTIDLTLPANSSFNLDASTKHGAIENEFDNTHVGSEPRALLLLDIKFGSIALHSR